MKSGKLVSTNDKYIEELINDPLYDIRADGTIWTLRDRAGHIKTVWRQLKLKQQANYLSFHYNIAAGGRFHLSAHRIVFRKFSGYLDQELVINHLDGNKLNNSFVNLELVTQKQNSIHRYRKY